MPYYAHSVNARGKRHGLVEHLRGVAELASRFSVGLNAEQFAYYAGLWHDLGKFHPAFQDYLLRAEADPKARGHGPDHKAAGATVAMERLPLLSLLVQGHHGGLHSPVETNAWLKAKQAGPEVEEVLALARDAIPDLVPEARIEVPAHVQTDRLSAELFLRLVFSALADADFLDTENHFNEGRATIRGSSVTLGDLWRRFEINQAAMLAGASGPTAASRAAIYGHCLEAAEDAPGFFRLTVPTGGGKTRSAMGFALRHALKQGLDRVVVAVPFISITEQTAAVYRGIFENAGENAVLEHHSMADTDDDESGDFHAGVVWDRLAAENWDAPIVVTTTVQLFQSLFSNKTSRTRKLHRLARSVIILDEAQALPPHLLTPILDVLRQLVTHYGATVVISTATQPAFEAIPAFADAGTSEIVPDPAQFFNTLRRVQYEWRTDAPVPLTEVASWLRADASALAVLNTKKDALGLLDALDDANALHLSTLLCGAHRRDVIEEVKQRLAGGQPCRLVSTQAIEAGVDLDFPLVLRALAPLDSIIQAAGRCNREGRLSGPGRVVVFRPEGGGMPQGVYRIGADQTASLRQEFQLSDAELDPGDLATIRTYYARFLGAIGEQGLDRDNVQPLRSALDYPKVAQTFRMIDEDTYDAVITTYDPAREHQIEADLGSLAAGGPDARYIRRRLQPYVVSLRRREALRQLAEGRLQEIRPGIGVWRGGYDSVRGFTGADPDPDRWIS